jgi:hypothetical protein
MIKATKSHLLLAAAGLLALTAAGCVSEKATPGAPLRDAAFLGYSNPDTKTTTCGNCHVDVQNEWKQTKHANAWADLQASGHAGDFCNKCHTTNGATNPGVDTAGFFSISADAKKLYEDVQCEACHGPGANHVSAPGESQPIPTIQVLDDHSDGCAACHYDTHNPFAEQLAASRHGEMPNWEGAAGSCQVNCHTNWGAIKLFAPRGGFREVGTDPLTTTLPPSLTCALCHDPHDATNTAQLRLQLNTTDTAQHACGKCHNRGPVATTSSWRSSRGGHSAQFATLMGYAGYIDASFGNIRGPARHGTIDGSCAACHMAKGPVNDASGNFAVQNTGHTFEVAPCLSPTATATGGVDTSAACTEAHRDFSACATGGCHGTQQGARDAMDRLQNEIKGYLRVLWVDANGNSTIEAFPTDSGWLPKLLQHDATRAAGTKRLATSGADTVYTVAKGARFNVLTLGSPNRHGDGSFGVHNPAFVRGILQGTVTLMRSTYATSDTLQGVPPAIEALLARPSRH